MHKTPYDTGRWSKPTHKKRLFLGSTVGYVGEARSDIKSRLSKTGNTFRMLNDVWKSPQYSIKLKLYQRCALPPMLYSSDCRRMTESNLSKLSTFHTRSLRELLCNTISDQLVRSNQESMDTTITGERWRWIGHMMQREQDDSTRIALYWTP